MFKIETTLLFCFLMFLGLSCSNLTLTEAQRKMSNKQFDEAIHLYKIHLEKNPIDSEAWYQLGISYAKLKDFKRMNKSFSQALKYNSKNYTRIKAFKEKYFNFYLDKIISNLSIYRRLDDSRSPGAQKLAIEINKHINIAQKIYPNDKRIPTINSSDFISNKIKIEKKQFEKLKNSNLALIDLTGNNMSKGTASAVTSRLFHELFKRKFYILLEREKIESILKEQSFQQSGCVSSECLVEIGKLLNVEIMLGGTVSKIKDFYMIDLRLIDVESGEIILTVNEDITGTFQDFIRLALPEIANKLTTYGG